MSLFHANICRNFFILVFVDWQTKICYSICFFDGGKITGVNKTERVIIKLLGFTCDQLDQADIMTGICISYGMVFVFLFLHFEKLLKSVMGDNHNLKKKNNSNMRLLFDNFKSMKEIMHIS